MSVPRPRARFTLPFALPFALTVVAACSGSHGGAGGAGFGLVRVYTQASAWQPADSTAGLYAELNTLTGGVPLAADPALATVAAEVARRVAADPQSRPPTAGVVQALSWLAGVTDPIPTVLTLRGRAGLSVAPLEAPLRELMASDRPTRAGIARASTGGDDVLVVVLAQRRVRLESISRVIVVGQRVAVRGALLDGLHGPGMAITFPDGHTEETPLGEGADFFGQFPAAAPGVYQVEIVADSPVGSTVVANFPVYVDVTPPATPEDTAGVQAEDPAVAETTLLRMINEARAHARLRPVESLPALTTVARGHSTDMAEHHYVAHNAPDGATPSERLRRAGMQSGLVLENVSRGYSAREIHDGLMASPGHRANVLNDRASHVGVGVARETGPGGGLLVTEDFIEVAAPIDVAAAPAALLASVNRLRQSRGAPDLVTRAPLETVAQAAAQAYFGPGRPSQEDVLNTATAQLGHEGLLFRRVVISAALGNRLDVLDRLETVLDRDVRGVGIGVAQGDRPDAPPRSVFVVYVLAVPR